MIRILFKLLVLTLSGCVLFTAWAYYVVNACEAQLRDTLHSTIDEIKGSANVKRGEYIAQIAGCISCHTDIMNNGQHLAGGFTIDTPFGKFLSPNITSDIEHGIGGWSLEEFVTALSAGTSPQGEHYFPAFPYTSYAAITAQGNAEAGEGGRVGA